MPYEWVTDAERAGSIDLEAEGFFGGGLSSYSNEPCKVVETHISVLVFLGDRVYKLRKPVHFEFLDFSRRAERELDCRREVEQNSRFAPDVYLGVIDVSKEGEPIDHAVVMRRLPSDLRLSVLVGLPDRDCRPEIKAIARLLVELDQYALKSQQINESASSSAISSWWHQNFEETARFVGPIVDPLIEGRVQVLVERFLAGRTRLFEERIAVGAVREGHGDLQAEDIFCLDDGPRVLDCVEFDETLRYGDVLSDLGFLAMDLERLGRADLAEELLSSYEEYAGVRLPRRLVHHYCASRAYVRLKVACLAAEQGVAGATEQADVLQRLCLSFLERARVRVILIGGSPGTGKSTLAGGLSEELGMIVLRSDEIRREVVFGEDRYSAESTARTYATMCARARASLEFGQSVILDASFVDERFRAGVRSIAESTASDLLELQCTVSEEVAWSRIRARSQRHEDASEATVAVAKAMTRRSSPWPEAVEIDTSGSKEETLVAALGLLS